LAVVACVVSAVTKVSPLVFSELAAAILISED
jgi:hypothetical protein